MEDNRKKWTQPQLIILGRGAPEENVLASCKATTLKSVSGSTATKTGCRKSNGKNCSTSTTKCSAISKAS